MFEFRYFCIILSLLLYAIRQKTIPKNKIKKNTNSGAVSWVKDSECENSENIKYKNKFRKVFLNKAPEEH